MRVTDDEWFKGRKLRSIELSSDKTRVTFVFWDGEQVFEAVGDCCSSSWIEHLETPGSSGDVDGLEILSVDQADMDQTENDAFNPKVREGDRWDNGREHESLQVYSTTLHTAAGDIVLEYRNSSNGYYGGWLEGR